MPSQLRSRSTSRLLGLSGITQKIQDFIKKVQSKVDAVEKLVGRKLQTG